ncbi:MHO_1590 family protein [Mycoplasmopsis sturni]|uniref:MHO_1590 family protein n=1 Tax=Mycoplasmopsis sturni TaxID=39047 RepID=UPI00055D0A39|nr:hypothetical protein [Mycoplasmopsis sturni]
MQLKKTKWILKIVIPILGLGILSTVGYFVKNIHWNSSKKEISTKDWTQENTTIFPDISESYFEEYLKDKNGFLKLDQEVIYLLTKDLSQRLKIPSDKIEVDWDIISDRLMNVYIKVYGLDKKVYQKGYKFELR